MVKLTNIGTTLIKEAWRCCGLRRRGPFEEVGPTFHTVSTKGGALFTKGGKMMHIVTCDVPNVSKADVTSIPAITLPDGEPVPEGLEAVEIPAGTYATCIYHGPCQQLPDAWSEFIERLKRDGTGLVVNSAENPSFEMYLSSPSVPQEEWQTQFYFPIETTVSDAYTISRTYPNASPEQVFNVYKDDNLRAQLNCGDIEYAEGSGLIKFEVGACATSFLHKRIRFEERFEAITENKQIIFTVKCFDVPSNKLTMIACATTDFLPAADDGTGTLLVVHEMGTWFDGKSHAKSHIQGYEDMFQKIETLL